MASVVEITTICCCVVVVEYSLVNIQIAAVEHGATVGGLISVKISVCADRRLCAGHDIHSSAIDISGVLAELKFVSNKCCIGQRQRPTTARCRHVAGKVHSIESRGATMNCDRATIVAARAVDKCNPGNRKSDGPQNLEVAKFTLCIDNGICRTCAGNRERISNIKITDSRCFVDPVYSQRIGITAEQYFIIARRCIRCQHSLTQ